MKNGVEWFDDHKRIRILKVQGIGAVKDLGNSVYDQYAYKVQYVGKDGEVIVESDHYRSPFETLSDARTVANDFYRSCRYKYGVTFLTDYELKQEMKSKAINIANWYNEIDKIKGEMKRRKHETPRI